MRAKIRYKYRVRNGTCELEKQGVSGDPKQVRVPVDFLLELANTAVEDEPFAGGAVGEGGY